VRQFILNFHGIGAVPDHVGAVEREFWLERDLYESILDEVRGRDDVAITFDDGNRSDADIGLPALAERGLRATFFVLADRIGERTYLGDDQIRELAESGMGVGSHGAAHRSWRSLADDELRREVDGAREAIESALGGPVAEASCPFGEYDRSVLGALRRAGFERVYTSDGGWADSGAWLQPRNTVTAANWPLVRERLVGREPARARALRGLKGAVKRWR
jgi:peptidoglycan/xylan/chitin deacetylase (PgdA/CDA1 family)